MYQKEYKPMSGSTLGELVSGGRASKGWSRRQLAEETGYSTVMIAKIESGERAPDAQRIADLARALGINEHELRAAATRTDGRRPGGTKIVDGLKLAKLNRDHALELKARAERLR